MAAGIMRIFSLFKRELYQQQIWSGRQELVELEKIGIPQAQAKSTQENAQSAKLG